jgi:hypothetical protein
MSADERLEEVVGYIAAGLQRLGHRHRQTRNNSNFSSLTDNSLDFGRRQSVDAGVSGDLEIPHAR